LMIKRADNIVRDKFNIKRVIEQFEEIFE
jgi:hypothetical protein